MNPAWETLIDWGVPLGAARPMSRSSLAPESLRAAMADVALHLEGLEPVSRDALRAWLRAFRQHWPRRFQVTLGSAGEECLARLGMAGDRNRYLKLRRIAIENLAARC